MSEDRPIGTVPRDVEVDVFSIAEKRWRPRVFHPQCEDPGMFYSHWRPKPPAPGGAFPALRDIEDRLRKAEHPPDVAEEITRRRAAIRERRVWEMFVAITGGYYASSSRGLTATILGLHEIARQSVAHHESWEKSE